MKFLRTIICGLVLAFATVAGGQTIEELKTHVEYLASDDLKGRDSASEGMEEAINYVREECKELGLQTYTQEVKVRDGVCNNLIAVLPGNKSDVRIVVGAHLDHIGWKKWRNKTIIYNGADDNASGSVGVLALAQRVVGLGVKYDPTIEFQWYTGEEEGLTGSKAYCKKPLAPIDNYKVMINLDMIGRLRRMGWVGEVPTTDVGKLPAKYQEVLDDLDDKYSFAKGITWASDTNDSDHASWWKAGVPAIIVHTGLHSDYHQGGDEADRINYDGMKEVCNYTYDMLQGFITAETSGYLIWSK